MTSYRVEERLLHSDGADHHTDPPLRTVDAVNGQPMDYAAARAELIAEELRRPELHDPHARTYLTVRPNLGCVR